MFSHDCLECLKISKQLEEKEKIINTYQNNLYELKSKMADSNNLINIYFTHKNENEALRKEIESLKRDSNKSVLNPITNSKINYEIELLKNKYLKECDKNKALHLAYTQLTAMVEELKNSQETSNKSEFLKLKKELSDKERQINSQNLTIEKLKSEISELKNKILELSKLDKAIDMSKPHIIHKETLEPLHNLDLIDAKPHNLEFASINLNNENLIENDLPKEDLLKENQYLTKKFKKYQNKYTKFKYKYEELKSLIQILSPGNFNNRMNLDRNSYEDNNLNHQIKPVLLSNKIKRSDEVDRINKKVFKNFSNFENLSVKIENKNEFELQRKISFNKIESSDIFEKDNLSLIGNEIKSLNDDINMINVDEDHLDDKSLEKEKYQKNKRNKKKTEKIKKQVDKKEIKSKKEKKEVKTQKEEKEMNTKNKKRKNKTNQEDLDEINIATEKVEKEIKNVNEKTPKEDIKNEEQRVHINPIKKSKTLIDDISDFKKKKEETENELINFINFENIYETSNQDIIRFFENYGSTWTSHEKIFNILEIVFTNPNRINFIKSIFLFCNFPLDSFFSNIKEFILSHLNIIIAKGDLNFLSTSNDEETKMVLKTYFNIENPQLQLNIKHSKSTPMLVSFILAILFDKLKEHTEFVKFILEILEIYNQKIANIMTMFTILVKKSNKSMTFENESELENYTINFNKIYFMHNSRKVLVTKTVTDFIFDYFNKIQESEDNLDEFILKYLDKIINETDDNVELKEIKYNKINFAIDVRYLEIFQIIYLLFKLKSLEWINKNIFESFLWNSFLNSKEGSLKRVAIIFYISYIMSNFIAKDMQCENESTKNLINWIYAIFDPKFNLQMISAYDRIAALSGFIDTHVIQYDKNAFTLVKSIIEKIIQEHGIEIFPDDFVEKLKKLNLLNNISNNTGY